MPTKLAIANLYVKLYAYRAAETTKKTAKKTAKTVSENKKELTVLTATSSIAFVTGRVFGFKAGYEFAKKPTA